MAHPTVAVLERHLCLYRRLWRASVFSFFVLPALFLVSIGIGVGGYVGRLDGYDYLIWIAPALVASTAFQIGVNESTYGVLSDFEWVGGLHVMRGTRVRIGDMIGGWLLYVLVVTQLSVVAFVLVAWAFGAFRPAMLVTAPWVCALLGTAVAAPTAAFSATIRRDEWFLLLSRFMVLPSTLFSGVFFPIDQLPAALRPLGYASPLWHGVELMRTATLGLPPVWPVLAHVGYLLLWLAGGYAWAYHAFRRRLSE